MPASGKPDAEAARAAPHDEAQPNGGADSDRYRDQITSQSAAAPDLDLILACATSPHVAAALDDIDAALRLYGRDGVLLSFNGGKDATVLLHLARAAYHRAGLGPPLCVYWHESDCFPEVDAFVVDTTQRFGLQLRRYDGSFADGMADAVQRGCRAVLLGTRHVDPNGVGASAFQPSSKGWPSFMRVNPVLRWTYAHVWAFLRSNSVPYCLLYDQGYTSLGTRHTTQQNPELRRPDGSYAAAHTLRDGHLERGGRHAQAENGKAVSPDDVVCALVLDTPSWTLPVLAAHAAGGLVVQVPSRLRQELDGLMAASQRMN
jgi:FAD synthetase